MFVPPLLIQIYPLTPTIEISTHSDAVASPVCECQDVGEKKWVAKLKKSVSCSVEGAAPSNCICACDYDDEDEQRTNKTKGKEMKRP